MRDCQVKPHDKKSFERHYFLLFSNLLYILFNQDSLHFSGATNVGSVQVYIDKELKTNKWRGLKVGSLKDKHFDEVRLSKDIVFNKGELVGQFNMGSTIVLVFEAPNTFR